MLIRIIEVLGTITIVLEPILILLAIACAIKYLRHKNQKINL